jgi:hypothetical protein
MKRYLISGVSRKWRAVDLTAASPEIFLDPVAVLTADLQQLDGLHLYLPPPIMPGSEAAMKA